MARATIIVIGGVPGVGKTSLCSELAKRFGIGIVLNGDYLREFARAMLPEDLQIAETLRMSVYDSWKIFGDKSRENVLKGYLAQGALLNKGVNAVIRRANDNGESLILETLYFIPEQLEFLHDDDIAKLYLYTSDAEVHKKHLLERTKFSHLNSPGERLVRELDSYRIMMSYSLGESKKHGIGVFDSLDYRKMKKEVLEYLGSRRTGGDTVD